MNVNYSADEIVGIFGVVLVLGAYLMLQIQRINQSGFWFSFLNMGGSLLILFSLRSSWNLPSALIESSWALISVYGLIRWGRKHLSKNKMLKGGKADS